MTKDLKGIERIVFAVDPTTDEQEFFFVGGYHGRPLEETWRKYGEISTSHTYKALKDYTNEKEGIFMEFVRSR